MPYASMKNRVCCLGRPAGRKAAIGFTRSGKSPISNLSRRSSGSVFFLNEIQELFSLRRNPHEVCEHVLNLIAHKADRNDSAGGGDGRAVGRDRLIARGRILAGK